MARRSLKMEDPSRPIHIVVIKGSVRPGNYTSMAAALAIDELWRAPKVSVEVVDPGTLRLPFPGEVSDASDSARLQEMVRSATGVILVTPEYHGSFSSVMKLVIENLGFPSALAGKPVALLGVAAGSIGAIKSLEHLRGVVSHVGGIVLPLPISIANVQKVFDREGHVLDPQAEKMVRQSATSLIDYIHSNICPAATLERLLREGSLADSNVVSA
jgi:chromate reductase, NAD(P)H dehydrogenase (quinone)